MPSLWHILPSVPVFVSFSRADPSSVRLGLQFRKVALRWSPAPSSSFPPLSEGKVLFSVYVGQFLKLQVGGVGTDWGPGLHLEKARKRMVTKESEVGEGSSFCC